MISIILSLHLPRRAASAVELASLNHLQMATRLRSSIPDQAMHIRLGMPAREDNGGEGMAYGFQHRRMPLKSYLDDSD